MKSIIKALLIVTFVIHTSGRVMFLLNDKTGETWIFHQNSWHPLVRWSEHEIIGKHGHEKIDIFDKVILEDKLGGQ